MDEDKKSGQVTVDHANKLGDRAGFDPYQFWLSQVRRSGEARRSKGAGDTTTEPERADEDKRAAARLEDIIGNG